MPPEDNTCGTGARALALAIAVSLVALLIATSAMDAWNRHAPPIFASRPHPPLPQALVRFYELRADDLWGSLPIESPVFWATNAAMRTGGTGYAAMMRGQIAWFALYVIATAWIGWMLAGASGAAWSAVAACALPLSYVGALAFDDHMFNIALTTIAVALLVASRGLQRWPLAAAAGVTAGITFRYAFVPSNGLLVLATALCASSGFAASGLAEHQWRPIRAWRRVRLRWGTPESVASRRGTYAWLGAMAIAGFFLTRYNFVDLHYYTSEIEHGPATSIRDWFKQIPAYGAILGAHLLGPVIATAMAIGYWRLFRERHPSRWVMATWFAIPLVVLSLVVKKNAYYIYYAAAAAGPVAGYGLARIAQGRWASGYRAIALVAMIAWVGNALLSDPPNPGEGLYEQVFQEPSAHILRSPGSFDARENRLPAPGLIRHLRRERSANGDITLLALGSPNLMERLRYGLLAEDPRIRVRNPILTPSPIEPEAIAAVMIPCALVEGRGALTDALDSVFDMKGIDALDETRLANLRMIVDGLKARGPDAFVSFEHNGNNCFYVEAHR